MQKVWTHEMSVTCPTHFHDLYNCIVNIFQRVSRFWSGQEIAAKNVKGKLLTKYEGRSCHSCMCHVVMIVLYTYSVS